MGTIVDYARSCSDTFEQQPLSRVDSLVFSWLAYARLPEDVPEAQGVEGITLAEVGALDKLFSLVATVHNPRMSEELLRACAASPRFSGVRAAFAVDDWSPEATRQFSATTFLLPEGGAYVAFRGTDNTLVGWEECLNMSFLPAIPAQIASRAYLERAAAAVGGPLYVGGHSKGGNLAVYALSTCNDDVRGRVACCFAHDAPGFTDTCMDAPGWVDSWDAVDRTMPEESLVGLLLDSSGPEPAVVRSTEKGLMQHSPLSWVVSGDDFSYAGAVTYDAWRTARRLRAWLLGLSDADRERMIRIIGKLARATGEITASGLVDGLKDGSLSLMAQRYDGLPEDDRAFFRAAAEDLAATMLLGPAPVQAETPTERTGQAADKIDDVTARFAAASARLDKLLGL